MPRSYRCILVAFVGVALAAAQQPGKQQHGGTGTKQASPTKPPKPPYAAYPDKYAEACYGAKDHDAADLCAQWRAAIASEKTAHEARRATNWAIAATFLSLATVIGLIVTIWQTFGALGMARRSNLIAQKANARATRQAIRSAEDTASAIRASKRQAKAATAQVKIAQDTAYRELRAYLSVEVTAHAASPNILGGKVIIRNSGATPAQVRVFVNSWVGPFPTMAPAMVGPAPERDDHHHTYINRNSEEWVQWFYPEDETTAHDIDKLTKSKADTEVCLYVYGRVEFVDFLRHERVLHFSYRLNGLIEMGEVFEMIPDTEGNEYEDRSKPA